ncbi:hypothetical protein [Methanotorris formicicus]|nr:hypothetical protein [Methanotorris formicicus]
MLFKSLKSIKKMDKGNFLKEMEVKFYDSKIRIIWVVLLILFFVLTKIYVSPDNLFSVLICSGIVALEIGIYIILTQELKIEVYEKGILVNGIKFYSWKELKIKEKDGKRILKIPYIPKEITI